MIGEGSTLFITVLGQVLDFTRKVNKGLININKCRSFGVQYVEEPTDPTSKLVFFPTICSFRLLCKELIDYQTLSVHTTTISEIFPGFS